MFKIILVAITFLISCSVFGYEFTQSSGCIHDPGDWWDLWDDKTKCCWGGHRTKHPSNNILLARATTSFPDGSNYTAALIKAWSKWNNGASNVNLGTVRTDGGNLGIGNGHNEIWVSSDQGILENHPAVVLTFWDYDTCQIAESDMIFDANLKWTTGNDAQKLTVYGGNYRSFEGAAMHEFGHVMGLGHEGDEFNIMGNERTHVSRNSNTVYYGPGEDGNQGAVVLYGQGSGREDLGASHFKYDKEDANGYSQHKFGLWCKSEKRPKKIVSTQRC